MSTEPRAALDRFVAALEAHLAAAGRRTGEADPAVQTASDRLADAFEAYDDALYDAYDEVTPLVVYEEAADDDEDDEDDLDDEDDEDDLLDEEDLALDLPSDEVDFGEGDDEAQTRSGYPTGGADTSSSAARISAGSSTSSLSSDPRS
jgi:hypothetical protein